jgi:stage V sporulation protein AC
VDRQRYWTLAKSAEPKAPWLRNGLLAFLVGGTICTIGQAVQSGFVAMGMTKEAAVAPTAVVLVGAAAVLTALGVYDRIVAWAGMGGALPITGFANAMVSPAMEFRREGLVLGTGARIFQVAGPVLTFGLMTAFVAGLVLLVARGLGW